MEGVEIRQGDSLGLLYGLDDVSDLTGWNCRVVVKDALADATPILDLNLTSLNAEKDRFVGLVTRSTTNNWTLGDKFLVADVYNNSTGEGKEIHATLRIAEQGVP